MAVDKDVLELDLYGLLGIGEKASEKEVKKAYRQKALTCHPDKNPDNPRAAEVFHQLSQALAVLTDAAARAAYDRVRKAKQQAAERTRKLDEKRKKVKLDLEAREREAQTHDSEEEETRITRSLEQEIIRLREEGSRQLEEQQRLIREQIRLEREQHGQGRQEGSGVEGRITPKLKVAGAALSAATCVPTGKMSLWCLFPSSDGNAGKKMRQEGDTPRTFCCGSYRSMATCSICWCPVGRRGARWWNSPR
ncbi:dnaJ homolog subfamily C member 17 isoform X3 [Patagioenas fasciata]|uniref:dnaJ homolog subfamily C member 17 isoform X3 n=1 Tax=Patagioenas fasciata TaxID=372321 RepID=UPI003A991CC6